MTQVKFYTLAKDVPDARLQIACRLSEKARELGHRVYILTASSQQAKTLDDLLWQFKADSFIPHQLSSDPQSPAAEVQIAATPAPADFNDVLINLSATVCTNYRQFSRINEIVAADQDSIDEGRERYRFYREAGLPLETYKL